MSSTNGIRNGAARWITASALLVAAVAASTITAVPASATASADASTSYAEGPGLDGTPRVRIPQTFTIRALDAAGNPLTTGGDSFTASLAGPENRDLPVTDNGDGTYGVAYNASKSGSYTFDVRLGGLSIKDMPRVVTVLPSADPSKSYAVGPGLEQPVAGSLNTFTVLAVDFDGKPRTDGTDAVTVTITGPQAVTPTVTDNGDGTYTVTYTTGRGGTYTIDTQIRGTSIRDMPRTVVVPNRYTFDGWAGPTRNPPAVNQAKTEKKEKLSWRLADALGTPVGDLGAIRSVTYRTTSCTSFTADPAGALPAAPVPGTSLSFDPVTDTYSFWWATPRSTGCYTVFLTFDSGQVATASFALLK